MEDQRQGKIRGSRAGEVQHVALMSEIGVRDARWDGLTVQWGLNARWTPQENSDRCGSKFGPVKKEKDPLRELKIGVLGGKLMCSRNVGERGETRWVGRDRARWRKVRGLGAEVRVGWWGCSGRARLILICSLFR